MPGLLPMLKPRMAWAAATGALDRQQEGRGQGRRAEELRQQQRPDAEDVRWRHGERPVSGPCDCCLASRQCAEVAWVAQGEISDDEFREYFLQFGDIEDCVVRQSGLSCFCSHAES